MGAVEDRVRQLEQQLNAIAGQLPGAIALAVRMGQGKPSAQVSISYGTVVTLNTSGTVDVLLDGEDTPVEMPTTTTVAATDRVRILFVPPAAAVVLNAL